MATEKRVNVNVRLSENGLAAVDYLRGGWSRSEYVRQALADAVRARKRGPDAPDEGPWEAYFAETSAQAVAERGKR